MNHFNALLATEGPKIDRISDQLINDKFEREKLREQASVDSLNIIADARFVLIRTNSSRVE